MLTVNQILMTDRPETYEDWLENEDNANAVVDACKIDADTTGEVTANLIKEWFFDYHIGWTDATVFRRYLVRNIRTCMPQYEQKLRNQPGVGITLDNLVTVYRERQLKTKGSNAGSTTHGQDITNTSGTDTTSGSTTHGHTITTTDNGTDSSIRTGSQISVKSGDESTVKSGDETAVKTGSETMAKAGDETRVKSGGHTTTDVQGEHTQTYSPKVQKVTQEDGGESAFAGDASVQSNLPMSKQYTDAEFDSDGNKTGGQIIEPDKSTDAGKQYYQHAYQHMPALEWNTLSSQAQSGHREYHDTDHKVTESYVYGNGVTGDITVNKGSEGDPDKNTVTYNNETEKTTYGDRTDTTTYNDITDRTTYNNITDKTTYNDITDKTTYDNITDAGNHTNTNIITNGGIDQTAGATTKQSTAATTYGNIDTTGSDERTDREQVKGRNEDPATLLQRAVDFIGRSNAWLWLRDQLEPCFDTNMED